MSLKIGKKLNNYRSAKGFHFVYEVKGSPEELAEYNEYRASEGWQPGIFNSLSPLQPGTPVEQRFNGTGYIAAQDLEQEFEKQQQRAANATAYVQMFGQRSARVVVEEDETVAEEVN